MKTKFVKKTFVALSFMLMISTVTYAQLTWSGTQTFASNTTITQNITLTGNTTINVSAGVTATVSGAISGSFSITKTGAGILSIQNTNNSYTGATNINGGIICLGSYTGTNGNLTATSQVNISAGCGLNFDLVTGTTVTFTRPITGVGNIYKSNTTGKIILTAASSYTGSIYVHGGIFQIGDGANGSINNVSGIELNVNGTLRFEPGADMTFSKVISGDGKVECKNDVTKQLYFTANNTYTGTTTVEENGRLRIGANTTTGAIAGDVILQNNTYISFRRSNDYTYSGVISGAGNIAIYYGKVTLTAVNTYAGNTHIYDGGMLALGAGGSIENSSTVELITDAAKFDISAGNKKIKSLYAYDDDAEVILGSSTLTIGTAGQNDGGGNFSLGKFTGTGGVTKTGTATFTMSAQHGATGTFTHSGGTLNFSGKWSGNYVKQSGATLTVTGNPTIGGNLTLAGGAINMNLTASTPSKLSVTGALSASGTNTLNITTANAQNNYVLIEAASGITSLTPYTLAPVDGFPQADLNVNSPTQLRFSTTAAPVLGGTVTINGNAVFGETLAANTAGLTSTPAGDLGTLSYQWKRNGATNIGTGTVNYTLVQDDIGATITVTVTAANCNGSVTSAATATITKAAQTAPAAPTMASRTSTSITLNTVSGCEYNIDGGEYQTSPEFTNLTPLTAYAFTQRKEETATHFASSASAPAAFITESGTGIAETALANILVYPNPTTGELIVENGELKVENVGIFDITGRSVGANLRVRPDYTGKTTIDISHLPAGIYYLKINVIV